jgi:predicted helicase
MNLAISITGAGAKEFSPLMMSSVPDYNMMAAGCQCFPLYAYKQ